MILSKKYELSNEAHKAALDKGFWESNPSDVDMLTLVVTELSEAVDADRKGRYAKISEYEERIKLLDNNNAEDVKKKASAFVELVKDSVEDEFADAYIRLLDIGGRHNVKYLNLNVAQNAGYKSLCADGRKASFCERIYLIMSTVFYDENIEKVINVATSIIECECENMGIDLEKHIEHKMWYNSTRERKHGKKY